MERTRAVAKAPENTEKVRARTPSTRAAADEFRAAFDSLFQGRSSRSAASEEEVFAAVVSDVLEKRFGTETAGRYGVAFDLHRNLQGAEGRVSAERAARKALEFLRESGDLTQEDAADIRRTSFGASQLDSNTRKLFDHIGGPDDTTRAAKPLHQAARMVAERMEAQLGASPSRRKLSRA